MGWVLGGSCAHAFLGFIFVRLLVVCLGEKEGGSASVCVCVNASADVSMYMSLCVHYIVSLPPTSAYEYLSGND